MGLASRAKSAVKSGAKTGAGSPGFENLHPRVRAGRKGAGQFIDVLDKLQADFGASFNADTGIWTVPNDRKTGFLEMLDQLGWRAATIPPGMHLATPEERDTLKIPPGWDNVFVSHDTSRRGSKGLVALGTDKQGRRTSRYTAEHEATMAAEKFARVRALAANIEHIDNLLERDASEDDTAAVVMLMRHMGVRPGSRKDTGARKQAYGATTLERRHIRIVDDTVFLDFIGKEGVHLQLDHEDAALASMLRTRLKGKQGSDPLFDTDEVKAREWMSNALQGMTSKDLRTHLGTGIAHDLVEQYPEPTSDKELRKFQNEIADEVSKTLGNTRQMALKSYIDPAVWSRWSGVNSSKAVGPIDAPDPHPTPTAAEATRLTLQILPERGELYFNQDKVALTHKYGIVEVKDVSLAQVTPVRARPKGIQNAKKFMAQAALGEGDKRDPVTLVEQEGGGYRVFDGNSTYAIADEQGWAKIPAIIARDEAHAQHIADVAKAHKQAAQRRKQLNEVPPAAHPERGREANRVMSVMARDGEDQKVPQAFESYEAMTKAAARDLPKFDALLTEISQASGALKAVAPLKDDERAREKIAAKYGGDHNRLQDVVRGSLVVDTVSDLPALYDEVRATAARRGWAVRKYENRFLESPPPFNSGATPAGYRDVGLALVSPGGTVTELQLHTRRMFEVKDKGHALYEEERAIQAAADLDARDTTPAEKARIEELRAVQRRLYDDAWTAAYA